MSCDEVRAPEAMCRAKVLAAVAALVLLLLSWTGVASPPATGVSFEGDNVLRVMTYNLYFGSDLTPALAATTPQDVAAAATTIVDHMRASEPPARMAAIAREIAQVRPHVVGLQEVATWSTGSSPDAMKVEFDFLQLLLNELARQGCPYTPVVALPHTELVVPSSDGLLVRLTFGIAILVRSDLPAKLFEHSNPQSKVFDNVLTVPIPGRGNISIPRGWASVDVMFQGKLLRFIVTHLESAATPLTIAQAGEVLAGPANTRLPVIVAGDMNSNASDPSDPGYPAYGSFVGSGGFEDAWVAANGSLSGFTCCQSETLKNAASHLNQRIDFLLVRGGLQTGSGELWGEEPGDRTPDGLWPSDHAGVSADFVLLGKED